VIGISEDARTLGGTREWFRATPHPARRAHLRAGEFSSGPQALPSFGARVARTA
jgi:hypothetical protein